jgi:hypothetical protein
VTPTGLADHARFVVIIAEPGDAIILPGLRGWGAWTIF